MTPAMQRNVECMVGKTGPDITHNQDCQTQNPLTPLRDTLRNNKSQDQYT